MLNHVVMWNVKNVADKEQVLKESKRLLIALKDKIPSIEKLEVGINVKTEGTVRDIVLFSSFKDLEALNQYRVHPSHVAVKGYFSDNLCDYVACDYYTQEK